MHERLLDETEGHKVAYMWKPWCFDVGDQCLLLPPQTERSSWEEIAPLYSQMGVVLKRIRSIEVSGADDLYDVVFNVNDTALVIEEIPGAYLQRLGSS